MLMNTPKELAAFVSDYRKRHKISQAEIGRLVGLKQQTISEFENKPAGTRIDTLFRILSALELDIQVGENKKVNKDKNWREEW